MNLSNWKMNIKPHQCNALLVVFGIMIGACLHYLFFSQNMDYVKKNSYQEGRDDMKQEIVQEILKADTTYISDTGIEFIYK